MAVYATISPSGTVVFEARREIAVGVTAGAAVVSACDKADRRNEKMQPRIIHTYFIWFPSFQRAGFSLRSRMKRAENGYDALIRVENGVEGADIA